MVFAIQDTLTQARKRKSDEYRVIEKNMKGWLEMYKDEIKKKYQIVKHKSEPYT
jgi:hypothetical protein